MPEVALLVLTHEGRELLARHLPTVVRAACKAGDACVWVVDNASTDGSVEFVRQTFPEVKVLASPTNDFLFSLNRAVAECESPLVVLLNDDLSVDENFLAPLRRHFSDPKVFAVACKTFGFDGRLQMARVGGKFDYGLLEPIYFIEQLTEEDDGPRPTLYASGGAAMFRSDMFVALGGFDRILWPIYWEDVDIGYRAWKRGWHSLYEPSSVVFHEEPATTVGKRMSRERIQQLKFRNQLLFTWKNVADRKILLHSFRTAVWFLRNCRKRGEPWRRRAIGDALLRLPQALWRRMWCARGIPDRTICPLVYE